MSDSHIENGIYYSPPQGSDANQEMFVIVDGNVAYVDYVPRFEKYFQFTPPFPLEKVNTVLYCNKSVCIERVDDKIYFYGKRFKAENIEESRYLRILHKANVEEQRIWQARHIELENAAKKSTDLYQLYKFLADSE